MRRVIELNDDDLEQLECYSKFNDMSFEEAVHNNYVIDNDNCSSEYEHENEYLNSIEDRYLEDEDYFQIDDYDNSHLDN